MESPVTTAGYADGLDPEELAFQRLYGPWDFLTPTRARDWLAGWDTPWWVCGGWAIDAATRTTRIHEDLDLGMLQCDLPRLRERLEPAYHLWWNSGGHLHPVTDTWPPADAEPAQVWVREHALAPWVADLLMTPGDHDRWVSKRDPDVRLPLDEATFVGDDGVRYLAPHVVLHLKALARRPKDEVDLERTLPTLDRAQRRWLCDVISRADPRHPWLDRIVGA